MASERRSPKSLGDLLGQSSALTNNRRLSWHRWRSLVGGRVAARSRPDYLDKATQTLTVIVASSTWAQELCFLKHTIVARLTAEGHVVSNLRFRVGTVDAPELPKADVLVQPATLPDELKRKLDGVDDPELREAIATAAAYCMGNQTH